MVFTLCQAKEMRVLFPRLLFLHSISLLPCKLYPGFYKAPPPMSIKASSVNIYKQRLVPFFLALILFTQLII